MHARICPASARSMHHMLQQRFLSSIRWPRSIEAIITSRFSKNYSVPKDKLQEENLKATTTLRPHRVDDLGTRETTKYYIRHNYIPMTRKSLAKIIMHEEMLISPEDRDRFHEFAVALDHSVGGLYHGVLSELKVILMPIAR